MARGLVIRECPFHRVPAEEIAQTDGAGLIHWGAQGNPDWLYSICQCLYGHRLAIVLDFVDA